MPVSFIQYDDEFFQDWNKKIDHFSKWKHVKSIHICGKEGRPVPKVTVCIPTYKNASVIKDAVNSVLEQRGFDDYDIIVSDDYAAGDAETEKIMRKFCAEHENIRYYRTEHDLDMAGNWNRTFELAESEYVVQLHSDDMMCPDYLREAYECAVKTGATMVGVFRNIVNETENDDGGYVKGLSKSQKLLSILRGQRPFHVTARDSLRFIFPATGAVLFKKSTVMEIGGFNGKYLGTLDAMFYFMEAYHGKVIILPRFLFKRRIAVNDSLNESSQSELLSIIRQFGQYFIKTEIPVKNENFYSYVNEIAMMQNVYSVKSKYIPSLDVKPLLEDMGIRKSVINMPRKLVILLNNIFLLDLIFRK